MEFAEFRELLSQKFPRWKPVMSTWGKRRISVDRNILTYINENGLENEFIEILQRELPSDVHLRGHPLERWKGEGYGSNRYDIDFASQEWELTEDCIEIPEYDGYIVLAGDDPKSYYLDFTYYVLDK